MASSVKYTCPHCKMLIPISEFGKHLKILHSTQKHTFSCGEVGCFRVFGSMSSLKKHLLSHFVESVGNSNYDNHFSSEISSEIHSYATSQDNINVSTSPKSSFSVTENVPNLTGDTQNATSGFSSIDRYMFIETIRESVFELALSLHNFSYLPRNFVNDLINKVFDKLMLPYISFIAHYIHIEKRDVIELLNADIKLIFQSQTEAYVSRKLSDKNIYIKPLEKVIDSKLSTTLHKGQPIIKEVTQKMTIVPIGEIFKRILEYPGVFEHLKKFLAAAENSSRIRCLMQCELWKKRMTKLSSVDTIALPFYLYFDDFEPDNPLGSHKKENCLYACYMQMPFLPLQTESKLQNIFLVMLMNSKYKKDRLNSCLGNLVEEIKTLETEGLQVNVNNTVIHITPILILILGDNLAMNEVLGYTMSFSANHCCRICRIHKTDMHTSCCEENSIIRNEDNYNDDVNLSDVSKTGVKNISPFSKLNSFNVWENISVDIMHDIYEGVCHYDISHVLQYLINSANYFSLSELNARKRDFDYGYLEVGNKSVEITYDNILNQKFNMSASEMVTFSKYLPLMIGDLVPEDDEGISQIGYGAPPTPEPESQHSFESQSYVESDLEQSFSKLQEVPVITLTNEEYLKYVFNQWNLPSLTSIFLEHEIDYGTMSDLSDTDLEKLIPKIGQRIKFKKYYQQHKDEQIKTTFNEMETLLNEWNLLSLAHLFKEHSIDVCNIEHLSEEDIRDLSPKIGLRIRMRKMVRHFQSTVKGKDSNVLHIDQDNSNTDVIIQPGRKLIISQKSDVLQWNQHFAETLNLQQLLENTSYGQIVLSNKGKSLEPKIQNILCKIIVEEFTKHRINMGIKEFKIVADKIKDIFVYEDSNDYFIDGENGVKPRGKLSEKFYNIVNQMKASQILKKKKDSSKEPVIRLLSTTNDRKDESKESKEAAEWLRFFSLDQDWPTVVKKWQISYPSRMKETEHLKLFEIYKLYPCLQKGKGYTLILKDFEQLYPEKCTLLLNNWELFVEKITPLLNTKLKDFESRSWISKITKDGCDKNNRDFGILYLLPRILWSRSSMEYCDANNEKRLWVPTKEEAQDSFILFIPDIGSLNDEIRKRKTKMECLKLSDQPYLIVCGTMDKIQEIFIRVDSCMYKLNSTVDAVDNLFKLFYVLNVCFPFASKTTWIFIGNYFYGLKNTEKKYVKSTAITKLLADLK